MKDTVATALLALLAAAPSGDHEYSGFVLCYRDQRHGGRRLHGFGRPLVDCSGKNDGFLGSSQLLFFRCVCGPGSLFAAGIFESPDWTAALLLRAVFTGFFYWISYDLNSAASSFIRIAPLKLRGIFPIRT